MGCSSSIEVKADRSTTMFSQEAPLDIQEPPRPKKANRTSAWQRSKIFPTCQEVAASPGQRAAWHDHDQNKENAHEEVDEEQEGIEAVFSLRIVSKARTNREGSELGSEPSRSSACSAPTPPPSCGEKSAPPQEPDAKTSQLTKSEVPCEGEELSLEERNMFRDMTIIPEPPGLLRFDSFKFIATRADVKSGHPLPPGAPAHKKYVKYLTKSLQAFQHCPDYFQDLALCRRAKFDKKMRQHANVEHMREEARQEILATEATKRRWSLNGSSSSK
ncbi:unnamed protein product [Polarella glacialis]|uniref:Uncharacterized protein n=1 Tax=Polarella glacialis TaxID=89957 RepID=A0A813JTZ4_POLGL|nr:unnamed protein product [Polarella glacialis]CAE8733022.1 unnamed protein product [Polarella glacialis]